MTVQRSERLITDYSVPVVVLVSSQHGGVGIIRSLGREGVGVYGVHQSRWEPAARSRFLRDVFCWDFYTATAAESVLFLLDMARKIGRRPVLIATSDETALFVAENAGALAAGYLFLAPPLEAVRSFASKKQTSELCRRLGIPTAETASPQSRDEVIRFAQSVKFPVIVKGEQGKFLHKRGQIARVAIVTGEKELLETFDLNAGRGSRGIILQEFIPGGDDTIWMFNGYFNQKSECLFAATGRKLRQFPAHRGSTSLGICEGNKVVETQTLQLLQAVGYHGPVDLGFRFDARDGQYKLLDVNPRIGATFRLFVAENGMDVARAIYLDLTGQAIAASRVCDGRKWMVESNDLISSWTYFREGQLTAAAWLRSLRDVHEGVWLASDDRAPLAALPVLWFRKKFRQQMGGAAAVCVSGETSKGMAV